MKLSSLILLDPGTPEGAGVQELEAYLGIPWGFGPVYGWFDSWWLSLLFPLHF